VECQEKKQGSGCTPKTGGESDYSNGNWKEGPKRPNLEKDGAGAHSAVPSQSRGVGGPGMLILIYYYWWPSIGFKFSCFRV